MGKKAAFPIFLLLALCAPLGAAQEQLSVDIDDPLYRLLEICDIRGIIPPISAVKPYSLTGIRKAINLALGSNDFLSSEELFILETYRDKLMRDVKTLSIAGIEDSDFRMDLSNPLTMHSVNTVQGEIIGDLGPSISYGAQIGLFLDKVDPEAFPPFDFTKTWDGFHIWYDQSTGIVVSNGVNDHLNESSMAGSELSLDLLDRVILLRLGRGRHDWGMGEGSLSLSGTARPIEGLYGNVMPVSWAQFHFLIGSLGNWLNAAHEQKMISIHRIELFLLDWLYVSPWESVIWAKRLEPLYLNPLMLYFTGQQIVGDLDNIAMGADVGITIRPFLRLYASVFIDEMAIFPLEELFTRAKNQFAWQAGVKIPIPWPAWSLFCFQYTKIEPYCYTHYLQTLPQYTSAMNISYTNDGENIGYHLPPNADEFLFRFSTSPFSGFQAMAQYQLIRHGTGDHLLGQIEGDIDTPIIYDPPSSYPAKIFLYDGIYEWINSLGVRISYTITSGITAWAQYSFIAAGNFHNIEGNDVLKHLAGLGISLRFTTLF
jgi:hypothetical protein